jgi:hypothetical protein
LGVLLAFFMAEPTRPITDHWLAFSMAEPVWTDGRTDEWVFFKKEQRSEPLLPLVFYFALGYQEAPLVFCFALGYQTEHWVCCGRGEGQARVSIYQEFVGKKKKKVLGFNFLGFLGDGFGVKGKKKAGTGGLCPTITGTHSYR